jgi:hypothetical protein
MLRATFETGMRMLSRASLGHMHKLSHGPAEVREENFMALHGTLESEACRDLSTNLN